MSSPRHCLPELFLTLVCGLVTLAPSFAWAGDWPQILGPRRSGVAEGERIVSTFPAAGPNVLWEHEVGSGFAGVAVAGGQAVVFHRERDAEVVEALDAVTGKRQWRTTFPASYNATISDDDGPRCVPVIHGDRVYVFGAAGDLHCVNLKDGAKVWSRAAYQEYDAPDGYFGAGSTPIVEGKLLLVNVGGRGAGLVAFNLADGKTAWKTTEEQASYSSPVAVTLDGVRHVIFVTRLSCVSIDPENGAVRWRVRFGARGPTVNGASPVVFGDHVFLSASYGVGAATLKIGKSTADVLWENDDTLSSQYTTSVMDNGALYGVDGRQDIGVAKLRCIDPLTGRIHWSKEGFGKSTLILADGKLVAVKTDGTLVLLEATPKSYRELASARLFSTTTRALPALSNGRLYVRDTQTLKCVDLRAK